LNAQTTAAPAISVIICAYTEGRWAPLVAAVESVQDQTLPAHEIIVVIDHNRRLLARVRERFPQIVAIENSAQQGLSGARNCGIIAASGAIIAFLDDDAAAAPDWLARLAAGYRDGLVLGVGGRIDPLWEETPPRWFPAEFNWVLGCNYIGLPTAPAAIRNLVGANMSFRREVFAAVGGFRPGMGRLGTIPLGCEETELCIRVHQRAPRAILQYEPAAAVRHLVTPNRTTTRYFFSRCWSEGRSKALVTQFTGTNDGLASERAYAFTVLPRGVLRGLRDAVLRGDSAGLGRAGAIIAGLGVTAAGYLTGALGRRVARLASSTAPALTLAAPALALDEAK
jgi:cellulose synthase/poly-beta-1,6-N-acetylglucosamine synthase-like glycosyltransferase